MRRALITGGNRGLGLETARQLGAQGFEVFLGSRDLGLGEEAARALASEGIAARAIQIDVADSSTLTRARAVLGRIDSLVANAAIALDGFDARVARETIDVNYFGVARTIDAFLSDGIARGGAIVVVSSGLGELSILSSALQKKLASPELTRAELDRTIESFVRAVERGTHAEEGWPSSAYGVSKAAVNALVRVLAREARGVAINAVCPGWVRTRMGGRGATRSVEEGADTIAWAAMLAGEPSGRWFRDRSEIDW